MKLWLRLFTIRKNLPVRPLPFPLSVFSVHQLLWAGNVSRMQTFFMVIPPFPSLPYVRWLNLKVKNHLVIAFSPSAPTALSPSYIHNHLLVGKEHTTIVLVIGNMYPLIRVSLIEGRKYFLFTIVCVLLFACSMKTEFKICPSLLVSSRRILQENLCFCLSVGIGGEVLNYLLRHDFFKPHCC